MYDLIKYNKGLLAQRLEQRTHNPLVVGSNPTGPTKRFMCECRLLFFGDIVGHPGRVFLKEHHPALKRRYAPDFVFANGENATGGFGLNKAIARELHEFGIDGITLGNHIWNQREFWDEISQLDYVCRPINLPEACPGNTSVIFEFKNHKLALLNLLGRAYSREALDCPYKTIQHQIENLKQIGVDNFIVDIHADATAEKYTLGWFLSEIEGVSCVVGTHTHIQTADERILNGTTAFICDLGMCGGYNSILGFKKEPIIEKVLTGKPCRFEVAKSPSIITGAFIRLDLENHRAITIERIQILEA